MSIYFVFQKYSSAKRKRLSELRDHFRQVKKEKMDLIQDCYSTSPSSTSSVSSSSTESSSTEEDEPCKNSNFSIFNGLLIQGIKNFNNPEIILLKNSNFDLLISTDISVRFPYWNVLDIKRVLKVGVFPNGKRINIIKRGMAYQNEVTIGLCKQILKSNLTIYSYLKGCTAQEQEMSLYNHLGTYFESTGHSHILTQDIFLSEQGVTDELRRQPLKFR